MNSSNGNFLDENGNPVNIVQLLKTGKAVPVENPGPGLHMAAHSGWFTDENGTPVNIVALINAAIDEDGGEDEPAIAEAVSDWLNEHPEATTTVEDGSLTYKKMVNGTFGFVTPEMFGAVGDGQTDDTTALQNLVNNGNVVHLRAGATYLISRIINLTKPITIYGHGATIKQSVVYTNTFYAKDISNITIDGVHIVGYGDDYVGKGGQTGPYGICITATGENRISDIIVRNCIVKSCTWCGISVHHANNVLVENNIVIGTGTKDLQHESNYQFGINVGYGNNITLRGNDVSDTAQGCYIGKKTTDIELSGNTIHDIIGQHGVYATSGINFTFVNNTVKNTGLEGIKLQLDVNSEEDAENVNISNNIFENTGSFAVHTVNTGAPDNIYIVKNIAVKNNIIKGCAVATLFSHTENVSVSHNVICNGSEGILFGGVRGTLLILNNNVSNMLRRGIGNYNEGSTLNDIYVRGNVLKECGQEGLSIGACNGINIINIACDTIIIDGNIIRDKNQLMRRAVSIGGSTFAGSVIFINNNIYDKPTELWKGLKEFSNNVCDGGLTISSGAFSGVSARVYTVQTLPTDITPYKNGDIFIVDGGVYDYAFAMLINGTWVMLGKKDEYVVHPFTLRANENFTINEFSAVSEGEKLTIHINVTINVRGVEKVGGTFNADSSLLPTEKIVISDRSLAVKVSLSQAGVITVGVGTAGETYDITAILIGGVLQSNPVG